MIFTKLHKHKDLGLLIMRIGLGISLITIHGWGKMFNGTERWAKLGMNMTNMGLPLPPEFWGFMAAFAEFGGGIMLILGIFFVPANILLMITMLVAASTHAGTDPWSKVFYPLELLAVFTGFLFTGPGKYSIDSMFKRDNIKLHNEK